jgi:hypothetical protein
MQPLLWWKSHQYYIRWVCVFVGLCIQHVRHMRHFVICGLSGSTIPFHIISKTAWFSKKRIEQKICDCIFSTNLSVTFLILRRTEKDMTINIYWSSCNVRTLYSCRILMKLEHCRHIFENIQISNFMKLPPLEAEFFHADGWLDRQTDRQTDRKTDW